MLEWKPRLVSLLIATVTLAVALGHGHGWFRPLNHGW